MLSKLIHYLVKIQRKTRDILRNDQTMIIIKRKQMYIQIWNTILFRNLNVFI